MLYDLARDPDEAYNLAATYPAQVRELAARLQAWRVAFHAQPRGWR